MLKVFPCGFGKHLWSVTEEQLQCYMKVSQATREHITYFPSHFRFSQDKHISHVSPSVVNFLLHTASVLNAQSITDVPH